MSAILEAVRTAWASFDWRLGLFLFITYIVIDCLNAFWTLSVTRLKPGRAAGTSVLIYFLLAFGVINYTKNFLYIVPIALGGATGTYLLVRYERGALTKRHRSH